MSDENFVYIIIMIGIFFLIAYIIMLLWNSSVVRISNNLNKINYGTALGILVFASLIFPSSIVTVTNNYLVRK